MDIALQPMGEIGRAVRSGLHELSHKKKAKFWRQLTSSYPSILDFLCNPKQLHQVRSPPAIDGPLCMISVTSGSVGSERSQPSVLGVP